MNYQLIQFDVREGVARLTLNRPDKMNSFNADMHAEIRHALDSIQTNMAVRVLVLTGAGRGFCQAKIWPMPKCVSHRVKHHLIWVTWWNVITNPSSCA